MKYSCTLTVKAYGTVREFEFVEQFVGGDTTTHYYPAVATDNGIQLDETRLPDHTDDVRAFRKLIDRWQRQAT